MVASFRDFAAILSSTFSGFDDRFCGKAKGRDGTAKGVKISF
jgi:hypothetical protein